MSLSKANSGLRCNTRRTCAPFHILIQESVKILPSLSLQFYDLVLSIISDTTTAPARGYGKQPRVDGPKFPSYCIDLTVLDLIEQGFLKGYQPQNRMTLQSPAFQLQRQSARENQTNLNVG